MLEIINELNLENGSNYKMDVLRKHQDNELLKRVLKMTYDRVAYNYGVSIVNAKKHGKRYDEIGEPELVASTLVQALNYLENYLVTRIDTGHKALERVNDYLAVLDKDDAKVFEGVINRDLRINMGRSNINKVFKNLITKPIYMRCDTYSKDKEIITESGKTKLVKGTARNISFKNKAYIQKKADGTYREFHVGATVKCNSRSGEEYEYPTLFAEMKDFEYGVYHGEITVKLTKDLLDKLLPDMIKSDKKNKTNDAELLQKRFETEGEFILPREIGNGLVNSDNVPHDNLVLDLWDYINPQEYSIAGAKDKKNPCTVKYEDRFNELIQIVKESDQIKIIECYEVSNIKEALLIVSKWMEDGFEGGILKDKSGVFKDGTSKHQLKLKLEVECDMRITGFTEGTGKNAAYFGAVTFENDEGTIKGKVGVSSMTETLRDWFHENRDYLIGKIMEVQFNDFTKARGHKHKALSHPRFIELRLDKEKPDTLEKVEANRQMAMDLS